MRGRSLIAIAVIAGLALAGGVAYATIPDSDGLIHGCYKTQNGQLRVIESGNCSPSEAALTWNQTGPTGAEGATGPTGPAGPPGPSGTLAWARVAADGTLLGSSGNVTVFHIASGAYCLGVTGGTPHAVTAVLDARFNVGGTIQASVFHLSGCPADATGIYVETRPQFQDGGVPGVDRAFYLIVV